MEQSSFCITLSPLLLLLFISFSFLRSKSNKKNIRFRNHELPSFFYCKLPSLFLLQLQPLLKTKRAYEHEGEE